MKKCSICGEIKTVESFHVRSGRKSGRRSECACCTAEHSRRYRLANIEEIRVKDREAYKRLAKKRREYSRTYYAKNAEKCREAARQYRKDHPERVKEILRKSDKKTLATVKGRLSARIKIPMWEALKGKKGGRTWESLVGYTVEELRAHIEKQFEPGMSWENWGTTGWHLDHKIPKSAFNYEKPEDDDFQKCWALENLQPLWAVENMRKHTTLDKPFQPSLIFK